MGAPYGEFNNGRFYEATYRYVQNGALVWEVYPPVFNASHGTYRTDHTVNRRKPIPGTTTSWIPPSHYRNSSFENTRLPCHRYVESNNGLDRLDYSGLVEMGYGSQLFDGVFAARMKPQGNMQNRAITECLLKLQDSKVNLGENTATAKQTLGMITDTAINLFTGLKAIKHGDLGALKRLWGQPSRDAANLWLAYIYGWKPLMSDIYGGWELLNSLAPKAQLLHARRRISEDLSIGESRVYSGGNGIYHKSIEKSANCTVTCHLTAIVASETTYNSSRAGLINPLSVAWEIVPWSFVIDWCIPVGNVIQGFDAFAGLDFVGGYVSQLGEGSYSVEEDYSESGWKGSPATGYGKKRCYERAAFSSAPFPRFYTKNPISSTHAATATALLRSLLK